LARCLYCGKNLWLRLSSRGSEFCGEEHRRQYDELVLARLRADEAEPAAPAAHSESLPESEPFVAAGLVEDERTPAAAGFREAGPVVALAAKGRIRQPVRFQREGMAGPAPRKVRLGARPGMAGLKALPVSPAAGTLQPQPAVEWILPCRCRLPPGGSVPTACIPRVAGPRDHHKIEFGPPGCPPVLATFGWTWRAVLPLHAGPVIAPMAWGKLRPARFIPIRINAKSPVTAPRHAPVWSHPSLAILPRRCSITAGVLPPQPRFGWALPQDDRARIARVQGVIVISPIVLPRLNARPADLPVLRREPTDLLLDPQPISVSLPRTVRIRIWWSAAPRLVRVAILALPLLSASVILAPRIPRAVRGLHWQRAALALQVETALRQRAVIEVVDDFRSGLSGWEGASGWSDGWSYDPAGFVHPGALALLTASRALADYRLEFLGLIERKGIGWVFRAANLRNYYSMKIVITRPGPLPHAVLVREVVVNGAPQGRVRLPLPMTIRTGKFYRIETRAYQDRFVTSVDGRVVDTFFDGRYRAGGVGLFSEPGEDARVMALRVADRDDFLGRLCAYFLRRSADSSTEGTRSVSRIEPGGIERK
jgi:hypothetical protein